MPKAYKKFQVLFPAVPPHSIEVIAADHNTAHKKAKQQWKSKFPILSDTKVKDISEGEVFYKEPKSEY